MRDSARTRAPESAVHTGGTADQALAALEIEVRPVGDAGRRLHVFVERLSPVPKREGPGPTPLPVGQGPAFTQAMGAVNRVAPSMLPVLLQGESGTGKELFARAVHEASHRRRGPFVVVDCSGLTETLFESELFGYERGAFTGALARKSGLVEAAAGGTLFLDEIGDVPLSMQVKLLRLIETGAFRRVGGTQQLHADFRLVCATHQPLLAMVSDGRFRQDLYFRISAFPIHLPALRERLEDLPQIAQTLLRRGRGKRISPSGLTEAAVGVLATHDWPGNVRELRNVLDRASLYASGDLIDLTHLAQCGWSASGAPAPDARHASASRPPADRSMGLAPDWQATARHWTGSRRELALALGWSERTLYRRLRAAGLARAWRADSGH
jgi:DNA-binding NtrC family response regulator